MCSEENSFPRLRNHKQYTDIENFKEFEFRSCISYELAIRNTEIRELIEVAFRAYIDEDLNDLNSEHTLGAMKYASEYFKKLRDDYFLPQGLYLEYYFFDDLRKEIEELIEQQHTSALKLDEIVNDLEKSNRKITEEEQTIARANNNMLPQLIFNNNRLDYDNQFNIDSTVFTHSERRTPLFIESLYHTENEKEESITRQQIQPNYSRPKLYSFHKTILRDIQLNLALPKKELVDFIERLSDDVKTNKNAYKSVNDLFFQDNTASIQSSIYLGKRMADMFYVYDYVDFKISLSPNTSPTSIIKEEGRFLAKVLEKQIDAIKKDYFLIQRIISECSYKEII